MAEIVEVSAEPVPVISSYGMRYVEPLSARAANFIVSHRTTCLSLTGFGYVILLAGAHMHLGTTWSIYTNIRQDILAQLGMCACFPARHPY